jgi:hypothetical protein
MRVSYKFKKIHDPLNRYDITDIDHTVQHPDVTLQELLEEFKYFLMASGFPVNSTDTIEIISEDTNVSSN